MVGQFPHCARCHTRLGSTPTGDIVRKLFYDNALRFMKTWCDSCAWQPTKPSHLAGWRPR